MKSELIKLLENNGLKPQESEKTIFCVLDWPEKNIEELHEKFNPIVRQLLDMPSKVETAGYTWATGGAYCLCVIRK